jgi:hypothetical protein
MNCIYPLVKRGCPLHRGVEGTMGLNIKQPTSFKEGGLSPPHKEEGHKGVNLKNLK